MQQEMGDLLGCSDLNKCDCKRCFLFSFYVSLQNNTMFTVSVELE